jgi:glycosyltransferase involved in cell wall biosynthesis
MVMLVSRFPFPLEKGDKLRAYYQLKSLSEHFSITLIALTHQKISADQLSHIQPYCDQIKVIKRSKLSILFNVFLTFFSNKPFQIGFFYSYFGQLKINHILKEVEPAYIYCQLIRAAEYVKNYHACPKTLDYMDALSMGIERRIKKTPWIYRIVFKIEAKRLKLYERSVFDYFEVKTIISEQDKQLILHPEKQQIHVIPNGIDPHFFEPLAIEASNELVFVGNLNYPPNIEAIDFIITELLPKNTTYKYLISGANPSVSLMKKSSKLSQITLNGWVDDIRTAYLSGKIFIAPMKIGTGMQNKLLEAMAVGLPCITTSLANNAIHAVHNESILVADTPEEFISCIDRLLTDSSLYKKIAENGQKLVQEKYSWKKTTLHLTDLIQNECVN